MKIEVGYLLGGIPVQIEAPQRSLPSLVSGQP